MWRKEAPMKTAKICRMGNTLGLVLTDEMLAALGRGEGDEVFVTAERGLVAFSAPDADFDRALEIARKGARKYRNALAELAK
jgi:putative addiction module antidote